MNSGQFVNLLNTMKTQPRARDSRGRQVASLSTTQSLNEVNGVLYKLIDEADKQRYRLLNDFELEEEMKRCEEIAYTILNAGGKRIIKKDGKGKSIDRHSGSTTFIPPKLGTSSQSRKIAARITKTDEMDEISRGNVLTGNSTLRESVAMRASKASEKSTLVSSLSELQSKYEKNLQVIEKLFREKEELRKKAKSLEKKTQRYQVQDRPASATPSKSKSLNQSTRLDVSKASRGYLSREEDDVLHGTLPKYNDRPSLHPPECQEETGDESMPTEEAGDESMPTEEAGDESMPTEEEAPGRIYPKYSESQPVYSKDDSQIISGVEASRMFAKSSSNKSVGSAMKRPSSARSGRMSTTSASVSASLQMDIDRSLMKKLIDDELKAKAVKEQELFEREKRERFERSLKADKFHNLEASHEVFKVKARSRQQKLKEDLEKEKKRKEDEELKKQEYFISLLQKHAQYDPDQEWEAIQKEVEQTRAMKKAIRKEELMKSVNVSHNLSTSIKSWTEVSKEILSGEWEKKMRREMSQDVTVPDPEAVMQRLHRQKELWESKVKAEEDRRKSSRSTTPAKPKPLESMEERERSLREKHERSAAERRQKKEAEERKRREAEEAHWRKLMSTELPETSINKSTILRTTKVFQDLEKQRDLEEKERRDQEKLQKKQRITAKMTMYEIAKYEEERREKLSGNYVELQNIDEISAVKANQKREDGIARKKEIQQKLYEAIKRRPSLMTRQVMAQASVAAEVAALNKVAAITKDSSGGGRNRGKIDKDLYTVEQQIKIGAMDEDSDIE